MVQLTSVAVPLVNACAAQLNAKHAASAQQLLRHDDASGLRNTLYPPLGRFVLSCKAGRGAHLGELETAAAVTRNADSVSSVNIIAGGIGTIE